MLVYWDSGRWVDTTLAPIDDPDWWRKRGVRALLSVANHALKDPGGFADSLGRWVQEDPAETLGIGKEDAEREVLPYVRDVVYGNDPKKYEEFCRAHLEPMGLDGRPRLANHAGEELSLF